MPLSNVLNDQIKKSHVFRSYSDEKENTSLGPN